MQIQQTLSIAIKTDRNLERALEMFREVQHNLSEPYFHKGKPLGALAPQRMCYHYIQASRSATHLVSATYASARSHRKPTQHPFPFKNCSHGGLRDMCTWYMLSCTRCGYVNDADLNAVKSIRNHPTALQDREPLSISPQAHP